MKFWTKRCNKFFFYKIGKFYKKKSDFDWTKRTVMSKFVIFDVGGVMMGDLYNELIQSYFQNSEKYEEIKKQSGKSWKKYKIGLFQVLK
jgi:hypothetical protein